MRLWFTGTQKTLREFKAAREDNSQYCKLTPCGKCAEVVTMFL